MQWTHAGQLSYVAYVSTVYYVLTAELSTKVEKEPPENLLRANIFFFPQKNKS